ncbi:hypothetical protein SLEP1_g43342 [Rubroshorea leprosula]|uniref:Uncharacterized protein n=1 Tax=Rubroshorea leprosula TaxID=152421 RepID=A0AAV5LE83_9ROSI|nr:hypothetical protein SLEP1_g43342 [Rubroshorea leprosula]
MQSIKVRCSSIIWRESKAPRLKLTPLPIFAFCLILLSSVEATADETRYFYCDDDTEYTIKVQSVDFSPNPVPQGRTATVSISASTNVKLRLHAICRFPDHTFNGGTVRIKLEPGFIWHMYDVCDKGWYLLDVEVVDDGNKVLTCISFQFQIVSNDCDSVSFLL